MRITTGLAAAAVLTTSTLGLQTAPATDATAGSGGATDRAGVVVAAAWSAVSAG